jgi:hypothetical protein
MKDEFEEQFNQLNEILVERRFARATQRNANGKIQAIELTRDGEILLKHLRKLFDVPKVKPTDLPSGRITNLIMVLLLNRPRNKS